MGRLGALALETVGVAARKALQDDVGNATHEAELHRLPLLHEFNPQSSCHKSVTMLTALPGPCFQAQDFPNILCAPQVPVLRSLGG
jgi:hypothetical protein